MKENTIQKMINRNVERQLVREYLLKETERAGFGGLSFNRTPEGTKVTLQAEQVGRVIGRRGKVIHELQRRLQQDFNLTNPQLEVEEIEESRTNAQVMASRLASSLERGWFLRRAGHSTVQNIMDAGARGCIVTLSGKITGARHRVEKFQKGHIKYCGETALQLMDVGFSTAVKKLGTVGCTVRIMRPGSKLPHEITIHERSESGLPELVEASGFVPLDLRKPSRGQHGRRSEMSHISSKEIDEMNQEQREITLGELRDEMLQLRSQQALGGSASNSGAYKQTRRSIARLLTKMNQEKEE